MICQSLSYIVANFKITLLRKFFVLKIFASVLFAVNHVSTETCPTKFVSITVTFRVQVPVRVQIGATCPMVFERDESSIGHLPWHACIVEGVPFQLRLKTRGEEAVPIATVIQHREVNVEEERVENSRQDEEADETGQEMVHSVNLECKVLRT